MHNSSTYRVGPRGGVYTVDFDGTRHYLDREQARRYIAQLTAKRSSGERSSPVVSEEVSTANLLLTGAIFFSVLSIFFGCFFEHPFWLLGLTFQLLKVLAAVLFIAFHVFWNVLTA